MSRNMLLIWNANAKKKMKNDFKNLMKKSIDIKVFWMIKIGSKGKREIGSIKWRKGKLCILK